MSKTTAPKTPSPHEKAAVIAAKQGNDERYEAVRRQFFTAVIDMSWQMALVVLIPVVGGFKLDNKLDTLPMFTISGFVLAMAGMGLVVRRQLKQFGVGPRERKGSK